MVKDKQKNYCGVLNCLNNSTNSPDLSYFRIPKDPQRAAVWLEKIHKLKNKSKKILVCEVHFEKRFVNENDTRKRLVGHAVPTLFLPEKVDLECTPDLKDACSDDDCSDEDFDEMDDTRAIPTFIPQPVRTLIPQPVTAAIPQPVRAPIPQPVRTPISQTVRAKVPQTVKALLPETINIPTPQTLGAPNRKKCKIEWKPKPIECPKPNSEDDLVEILYLHNKLRQRSREERYTDEFKFYALKLYFKKPSTYKVMQSLLNLPSISSLYRLFIPSTHEMCENLMIALKIKVDCMPDKEKECAVCIGTMSLKQSLQYDIKLDELIGLHDVDGVQGLSPADTALVVMVRGLLVEWKQAVGVAFLSQHNDKEDVRMYIINIIEKLFDIGLNVRVFIPDPKSEIDGIVEERKITVRNPFFLVNDKKVYYLYEPSYLLTDMYDNFIVYDIHLKGLVAKWKHVVDCYEHDTKKSLKLAPKLTPLVINGDHKIYKDKVKAAAEVFSMSTATAISAYADFKIIDPSAKSTSEFIVMMNNMFKILTYEEHTSTGHLNFKFLKQITSSIRSLRFAYRENDASVPHNAQFIEKMQIILSAFVSLNEDMKHNVMTYPVLVGLNRDCLQEFFDKVRNKHRPLPTCEQFLSALTEGPIFNVFQIIKKQKSDNLNYFLMELKEFSDVEMYCVREPKVLSIFKSEVLQNINLDAVQLPRGIALQHLAAYLLYEGYLQHQSCEAMQAYVFGNNVTTNADDNTIIIPVKAKHKGKTKTKCSSVVVVVPSSFREFIESLELILKLFFETEYERHPLSRLTQVLLQEKITLPMPCACFPLDFIKVLYIKYRFNALFKYNKLNIESQMENCDRTVSFEVNEL